MACQLTEPDRERVRRRAEALRARLFRPRRRARARHAQGLSTSILAGALADRGHGRIETVDIDADASVIARANLRARPGAERVTFTLADAADRMDQLIAAGASFGFVFVDHWHGYDATLAVVKRAKTLLAPGGFILFHDFLDPGRPTRTASSRPSSTVSGRTIGSRSAAISAAAAFSGDPGRGVPRPRTRDRRRRVRFQDAGPPLIFRGK